MKTTVDGITFASKKEATRYGELKLLVKAGEIRNLTLQPEFALEMASQHEFEFQGEVRHYRSTRKVGTYRADFAYEVPAVSRKKLVWKGVVEDVKGFRTPVYRLKKKMVEAQYGITVVEI